MLSEIFTVPVPMSIYVAIDSWYAIAGDKNARGVDEFGRSLVLGTGVILQFGSAVEIS